MEDLSKWGWVKTAKWRVEIQSYSIQGQTRFITLPKKKYPHQKATTTVPRYCKSLILAVKPVLMFFALWLVTSVSTSTHLVWLQGHQWYRKYVTDKHPEVLNHQWAWLWIKQSNRFTLAYDDVPSKHMVANQQFWRYSRNNHILIIWNRRHTHTEKRQRQTS